MLFPELSIGSNSWMERDFLAGAIERRRAWRPDASAHVLDDAISSIAATGQICATVSRSRTASIDGDVYLSGLLENTSRAYLEELGIQVGMSGALGSLSAHVARRLGFALVQMVVLSARYGLCKGPGRIVIALSRSSRHVRMRVSNDGIGEIHPLAPRQRNVFRLIRTFASPLSATVSVHSHSSIGSSICLTTGKFSNGPSQEAIPD